MADLKTSIIIRAVDKMTVPVRKMTAATGKLTDTVRRAARPAGVLAKRQLALGRSAAVATGQFIKQRTTLKGLLWTLGGVGSAVYGFKRALIDPAAEFERFETILKTIEGSSGKARESMKWIDDFAVKTPFDLAQVTDAFVKLRAYGMDPTDGLLRDLGDASSAMGKPLMQAVEAIADAVTGENERLKEFGIKARAVEGGKFRYEYTADGETRFAEALADDRAGIERTLREIFAARGFTGAMEAESQTFLGLVSNLMDQLTRFSRMVMESGAFEHLKDRLRTLLDTINQMATDGSLQQLAERIGKGLVGAFQLAESAARTLWPIAVWVVEALSGAAAAVGGWTRLATAVAGVYAAVKIGAVKAMAGGLFPAAPAIAAPGTGMLAGLTGKLAGAGGIVKSLGAVLGVLSIKFLAIGAVVAVVAGLVYKYWEPIKAFLSGVWVGFTEALQPVRTALGPFFAQLGAWIAPVVQWFRDLFVPVEMTAGELIGFAMAGKAVGKAIGGLLVNLGKFVVGLVKLPFEVASAAAEIGSALVTAIGDGITAAAEAMLGPLKWVLDKARALLPFSDARRGPLSKLTASGASILETMGLGVLRAGPGGLMRPLSQNLTLAAAGGFSSEALRLPAPAALPGFPSRAAGPPGGAPLPSQIDNSIHIQQLTVHQQPGEDAVKLAERLLREIEYRREVNRRAALYDEL
ncbi:MAG: tape measure protein [Bryobacterales bacterium]|nr:tape measure protein [Bryobacterales bacterium]